MLMSPRAALATLSLALAIAPAHAQVARLGVMGDSLTDEYAEEPYSYASNWLEQLKHHRGVDVGLTAAEAGQSGGTWGEPRRKFYKYDWAKIGASTIAVLAGGQASGLAGQYTSSGVTHGILLVGSNDFAPNSAAFINIYNHTWTQSQIDNYIASRITNMTNIVDTATAPGLKLTVCTFLDYSIALSARKQYTDPIKRERVSAVIRRVNAGIHDLCRDRKLPLVDFYGVFSAVFGTNDSIHDFLSMGGQTISLNISDTLANTNKLAGLCHDGIHPHTTLQGVFANYFITAMNIAWHADIPLFTEEEILAHAGVPYLGVDQLPGQLGPWSDLVTNYSCLADFDKSGFVDLDDHIAFIHAFEHGNDAADYNGSGFVDVTDFDDFIAAFELGC
ncbi:MAG: SGNH/GDSL hydrolase family protein [Phycisphaerales bacterium]|nr:SGNH/GDSL hydrolase family protein [Phycisphaerales bacterium]